MQSTTNAKDAIKKIVTDLDLSFVTAELTHYTTKTLLRKKAIRGGSIGPMTVTDAHVAHMRAAQNKIQTAFRNSYTLLVTSHSITPAAVDSRVEDLSFTFRISDKIQRTVYFTWDLYPTYAHNEYDRSYKTYWMVMSHIDSKI